MKEADRNHTQRQQDIISDPFERFLFLFLPFMVMKKGALLIGLMRTMMVMIIMAIMASAMRRTHPISLLLCSVPAGDCGAAGEAAGVGAEAGGVRGPSERSGRTSPEGADGVPGQAGGVGGAPAQTAG